MPPSPHPRSITGFLATAKRALVAPKSTRQAPLHLVVGNEAADLDSFCSAFLYAYLRSHTAPNYTLHIPLANIPHEDIHLRRDVESVFATAGVQRDQLISLSNLPGEEDLRPEDTKWILVDHNELTGPLAQRGFGKSVVGCIDHHVDEGTVSVDTGDEPRIIRPCGSNVSLVLEYCRETWNQISRGTSDSREDADAIQPGGPSVAAQLARFTMGPVLADTHCLKSKSKTTPLDIETAEMLEERIKSEKLEYDREAYFDELGQLKEDITGFSYRDVLRKDYKEWISTDQEGTQRLGVSSVPQGFNYLLQHVGPKEDLFRDVREWAKERQLDLVSIMTVQPDGEQLARELLLCAFNKRAIITARKFTERYTEELHLETWGEGGELDDYGDEDGRVEWRRCWHQHNREHSRKQVAPMLRETMKSGA
ncbi:hypothetical protein MCOR25_010350 [Pyricularia grisea]|nr:hypothetical protein MCOR25_010350 [Pyricularia grisea]